ncbi:MAG: ABC transporter ATP-binding protein [Rhizobiaceae bacterium]|nr:ABC transporter ATP-binding protein [Rhizobiaceae bacterium]
MSFLSLNNVSASYGSSQALFGVNLTLNEGEVMALMGRNGMGKSTTVRCICRMIPSSGSLTFASVDLSKLASHQASRLGIGLVPEGRRCFSGLSVYENLVAAARPGFWTFEKIVDLFPRLGERKQQIASSLSGGEQQMLAIGRALMTNPKLLILDEATEGLAPLIRDEIWNAIKQLKTETGLSILVIDKSVTELRSISDSAVILERGRDVWSGKMSELTSEITAKYVGV